MRKVLLVGLLTVAGCSSASPPVAPPTPVPDAALPDAAPTPAQAALAMHGPALRALPGVIDVIVDGSGAGLVIHSCRRETFDRDLGPLGVSAVVEMREAEADASGASCGCAYDGGFLKVGEGYQDDCNGCGCNLGGFISCTLMACDLQILSRVYFASGSAKLAAASGPLLDEVVATLVAHPEIVVTVIGHADGRERKGPALAAARADGVHAYLRAHGVPASQLRPAVGVGATQPLGGALEADRRVGFEVERT